jgi:hypothetical protein
MKRTQTPTQRIDWLSHFGPTHTPPMQVAAPAQALPHAPQLARSLRSSTQRPPHDTVLAGQAQVPPMQVVPPVHVTPQPPQFIGLDLTSTQPFVHDMVPTGHVFLHVPAPHTWPAAQIVPHAPQWFTSLAVATQTPSQSCWSTGHTHFPLVHDVPPVQVTPHAPQS